MTWNLQEWWRLGPFSNLHSWGGCDLNAPLPWHPGVVSPVRWIPGGDSPCALKIDPAHTFAMGFGKDFCAGSVIALSHMGIFGPGAIHTKLERAYDMFRQWVHDAKESCKISEFSLKCFKITSFLDCQGDSIFSNLTRSTMIFFAISFPPCYRNMSQATIFSCAWRARSWLRRSLQMAECFASECLHQWNCHLVRKVPRKSVNGIGCQKIVHTFCPPPTICSLDQGRDNKTIFDLMKWAADSANAFYRGLHGHGVWIPRAEVGWLCVCGWGVTDP